MGAGLAGLHCTYRLKQAGQNVTLLEGNTRVGGRTWTLRNHFQGRHVAELGAELVNSDHTTMLRLIEEFKLALDDLPATDLGIAHSAYRFYAQNQVRSDEEAARAFGEMIRDPLGTLIPAMGAIADEDGMHSVFENASARRFDLQWNVESWLNAHCGAGHWLVDLLRAALVPEYGSELKHQSIFNLIGTYYDLFHHADRSWLPLRGPEGEFRVYAASDERYHLRRGSDSVALALADRLEGRIETDHRLTALSQVGATYRLSTERKGGGQGEFHADIVVLALPFSTLRQVDLSGISFSPAKVEMIQHANYGTNAKLLGQFSSPVWHRHHQGGAAICDLRAEQYALQSIWDTSRGQPGHEGQAPAILTNFVGGEAGRRLADGTPQSQWDLRLPLIDTLFPGASDAYDRDAKLAERMVWGQYPWALGSYICPSPGQFHKLRSTRQEEGLVYFCGEHTSLDYYGFMEGAAETGARRAHDILAHIGESEWAAGLDRRFPDLGLGDSKRKH